MTIKKVKREQSTPYFPKNKHFLPTDTCTYVCVSGGKKCSFFRKMWPAVFSCYLRFEICLFDYRRCLLLWKTFGFKLFSISTAKNTVISPDFLMWKFCGKAQLPHSFGQFAIRPKLCGNCAFPQNFHTRKLSEITVFFVACHLTHINFQ